MRYISVVFLRTVWNRWKKCLCIIRNFYSVGWQSFVSNPPCIRMANSSSISMVTRNMILRFQWLYSHEYIWHIRVRVWVHGPIICNDIFFPVLLNGNLSFLYYLVYFEMISRSICDHYFGTNFDCAGLALLDFKGIKKRHVLITCCDVRARNPLLSKPRTHITGTLYRCDDFRWIKVNISRCAMSRWNVI